MADSVQEKSSSNTSNSNSTTKWRFHVFLSFMGQDTRRSFTDHLYAALWRRGIITFRDDEGMERGQVIAQQLYKAIEDSLSAIVVLSKNYASSTWCLDELQKILESRNNLGRQVFPVFYEVDPSDVRHQRESFAEALAKHEDKIIESKEKVQRWKDALTEVANLSGWHSRCWHETHLIENIVGVIWTKLCSKLPSYHNDLVGIDSRIADMNSQFGIGLDDIRFIGIWGMGGIGKTTLARALYERISSQFEFCCFIANIRENSEREDQAQLQGKLISNLNISGMVIKDTYEGKNTIRSLFHNKRVLIVLDDVNNISQLENLAESPNWFGAGSRIIITTRDMHLLKVHQVHGIYKIEPLKKEESLQLFSRRAFKSDYLEESYSELSESVVKYTAGLPLALKVLGSFLCGRSIPEWKDAFERLKQVPNNDILHILKISYDGLSDEEKTIFLDIACFFKGWMKCEVIPVLESCGLHPIIGFSILMERTLIFETKNFLGRSCIEMHDLLQELGRSIVYQESPTNACRRSRLWDPEDIDDILKNNRGTEAIESIVLPNNLHNAHWNPEAFSRMCNLKLLILPAQFRPTSGLKCLSSALKVVRWKGCPLKALPLEIPLDKLIDIEMSWSQIKQLWNGIQYFGRLKFINLSYSMYLIKTPNFSGVPNLERLVLKCCTSLVEVHPSLGELKKLVEVDFEDCRSLEILPRTLEMTSLMKLVLCQCFKVEKLPEFGRSMKKLSMLDLRKTAITELPKSLGFLTGLSDLNLRGCKNFVFLPGSFQNLKNLRIIQISHCPKFSNLPENLNENESLEKLDVSKTSIKEVIPSVAQLRSLKKLSFHGCNLSTWSLHHILDLTSLTKLDLRHCGISDGSTLDGIGGLSSLFELDLGGNNFADLPTDCISNLLKLHYLFLNSCEKLKSLPRLPPCLIRLDTLNCHSMEPLSDPQLWNLFSSLDHEHRRRTKYVGALLKHTESKHLPHRDFLATFPGSEIPSWFPNKCFISRGGDKDNSKDVSIMMDIPQSCRASEWSGVAVCFNVLSESHSVSISWTSKGPEDDDYICREWAHLVKYNNGKSQIPHLCLMLLHFNDQTCWQHLRGDYKKLQIKLGITSYASKHDGWPARIEGPRWRLICKEEMEEWCTRNGSNTLSIAESDTSEVWVPFSILDKTVKIIDWAPNQDRKRKREE